MTLDKSCINLQPGEVYFSQSLDGNTTKELKTILGSCVAITIWHSKSKAAGMCHYLLTQEAKNSKATRIMQKYRYGEEALNYLLKKMALLHPLDEYELAIYGGSNMYPSLTSPSIGEMNVIFAQNWANKNKLVFIKQDTLGNNGRSVTLDLSTGNVSLITYNNKGAFGEY
ncbi:chemotaxis protein CheD [Colwellia psychrerythraea]|uniref:CheD, deamidase, stimulates methylation of MCP protein n=1 Tax=Colwellia psychrerythraea TaxID=28229 RepID=A0A099KPD6_COLPS|nr:chemotaxis protein CheD [Colwellia psychrerythraea]KGJ91787.1 CheD, deamidase, stimulates methylation of MCP protein [Colwellia psychrerythraea]